MKRAIVIALISLFPLAAAAPASATSTATPTTRQLARQIKALQKEVKTLRTQVRQARAFGLLGVAYGVCLTGATADAFQGTWAVLDQKPGATPVGPQTPINDFQACQALQIRRAPGTVPPNVSVFSSLTALFQ